MAPRDWYKRVPSPPFFISSSRPPPSHYTLLHLSLRNKALNTSHTLTMLPQLFPVLLTAFSLLTPSASSALPDILAARALGINCRGSSECGTHGSNNMAKLQDYINGIQENRLYSNGYHIACVNTGFGHGICAFLQNADHQVTGGVIKELIRGLVNHNCKNCGSNPVYNYGGSPSNDPQWGILTVNYVANTNNPCDGLCG